MVLLINFGCAVIITTQQISYWKNDKTLFSHTIKVTKNNAVAYGNLGYYYEIEGQLDQAVACYRKAMSIHPYFDAIFNLGNTFLKQDRIDDAILHYQKALAIKPNSIKVLSNLAGAYFKKRQYAEALSIIQKGIDYAKVQKDFSTAQDLDANLQYLKEMIEREKSDSTGHFR